MTAINAPSAPDRAVDQMLSLDRHYELNLWPEANLADRRHDLGVMFAHGDLVSLATELLSPGGVVLLEYVVRFDAGAAPAPGAVTDLPLIDRRRIKGGRILVHRHGHEARYRHLLRLNWSPAPKLEREAGDGYPAGDGGAFHVGRADRRPLLVTQAGPRFAFADFADEPPGAAGIFLLPQFAEPGLRFQAGQRLSAVIVWTPKGLQGRAIRAH